MGAALRLYTEIDDGTSQTGNSQRTLRDVCRGLITPGKAVPSSVLKPATLRNYSQAVDCWERLTADPELDQLRQADVSAFRADLQASGIPATTANKHLRSLRALLNRIGPASARYPDAAELLHKVPFVTLLPEPPPVPLHLDDDELSALWQAARRMTWPRIAKLSPPNWWRGLIVLGINYAPRIGDLMGLTWNNVEADSTGELWVSWRALKTGKIHRWPANPAVLRALDALQFSPPESNPDPENRILPAPSNPTKLYQSFRTLCDTAKVYRDQPLSFHVLRSTAAKCYDDYQRGLGAVILGHAVPKTVTSRHYLGDAALADAYQAIRSINQPAAFL